MVNEGFDWDSVSSSAKRALDDFIREGFAEVLDGGSCVNDYGAVRLSVNAFNPSDDFSCDAPFIMRSYLANTKANPFSDDFGCDWDRHFFADHEMFPSAAVFSIIYDLIIREAKSERGGYAHRLFLYLFKTYRPDLYKRLKRYSVLTAEDAFNIVEGSFAEGDKLADVSLVLVAASFMGISYGNGIPELCARLTHTILDVQKSIDNALDLSASMRSSLDDKIEKFSDSGCAENWTKDGEGRREALSYLQKAEEYHGIPFDMYEMFCRPDAGRAAVLADACRGLGADGLSGLEKNLLLVIDALVELISRTMNNSADSFDPLFAGLDEAPVRFDPKKVWDAVPIPGVPRQVVRETQVKTAPEEPPASNIPETDSVIITRVRKMERELKDLNQKLAGRMQQEREIDRLQRLLSAQAQELSALRTFAYNSTSSEESFTPNKLKEAKAFLASKRIAVIGGHANWVQKIKKEMGDGWKFVKPSSSGIVDAGFVTGMDFVFFFTDVLSHATYEKYVRACRENGVKFGYLHGVNVEQTILSAYNAVQG